MQPCVQAREIRPSGESAIEQRLPIVVANSWAMLGVVVRTISHGYHVITVPFNGGQYAAFFDCELAHLKRDVYRHQTGQRS